MSTLISWNVTKRCNLKCLHCYRDAGKKDKYELNTKEGKDLLERIAQSGFKVIVFSGGEPLLRKDIYKLISYAKELNLRTLLGTNGTIITKENAISLKESGIDRIGISLDSINKEKHNRFRNKKGAHKKTLRGIENCKRVGLDFQIHTTVMGFNYDEIEAIADFSKKIGAKAFHVFFLVYTGRAKKNKRPDVQLSKACGKKYEMLIRRILGKQKEINFEIKPTCAPQFMRIAQEMNLPQKYNRGCLAGIDYCCILPNGDVHPCPYLPLNVGNVRKNCFSDIWEKSEIFTNLRSMKYDGKCGQCDYKDMCGGCRARAYYYFKGNYMEEDYYCGMN
ncbi:MAG: radical SAM protein [bacterium]|nr:radical SAM protein [bacterium]